MVQRVGIVGSGIMGAGVAEVVAKAGLEVVLRSRAESSAQAMVATLEKSLAKQVEKGKLDAADSAAIRGRVRAVTDLAELATCDLVLESVVEDLAIKQELFRELDTICTDAKILATNTSTLSVERIAAATKRPEQVCGIHFFNPAPVMPLVEVVHSADTSARDGRCRACVRRGMRQDGRRRRRSRRLHRERIAVPVPQQRGEGARRWARHA